MKLENQVTSLELSKKLKELGVKQESLFKYCGGHIDFSENDDGEFEECPNTGILDDDEYCHTAGLVCEFTISAFTVAELGEMLPRYINDYFWFEITRNSSTQSSWNISYRKVRGSKNHNIIGDIDASTEADARAKMLIYLLENKLITL